MNKILNGQNIEEKNLQIKQNFERTKYENFAHFRISSNSGFCPFATLFDLEFGSYGISYKIRCFT